MKNERTCVKTKRNGTRQAEEPDEERAGERKDVGGLQEKKYGVQKIALTALFAALVVVLGNITQIPFQERQFNFGFLATAVAAYMLGIPSAVAAAVLGDVIGALLFPTGPFFPGFTLTAGLVALGYGLILGKGKGSWPRVALAMLAGAAINLFLNSYWLSLLYTSKAYWGWVSVRVLTYLPELPLQILVTGAVLRAVDKMPLPDYLKESMRKTQSAQEKTDDAGM